MPANTLRRSREGLPAQGLRLYFFLESRGFRMRSGSTRLQNSSVNSHTGTGVLSHFFMKQFYQILYELQVNLGTGS